MSDVECDGILSCDCGADDEDSPKRLLRLSSTDKLNQITVSRNLFPIYYVTYMRYDAVIYYVFYISFYMYDILFY